MRLETTVNNDTVYLPHPETFHEVPPKQMVDRETGEAVDLAAMTDAQLLELRQLKAQRIAELRTEQDECDAAIRDRMAERDAKQIAGGALVVELQPGSDTAKVRRDWWLELVRDGSLTVGECAQLLPAEVKVNLRGWDTLEKRGLRPSENGSREPGTARLVVKERRE